MAVFRKQAEEMLEALKETKLWDEARKQWNWSMNKGQQLIDSDRFSHSQLLGVLAEAFDEKGDEFIELLTGEE